jgi:lysyl-tRNA synthetase class II|tara:strand:+ start:652 stop:948 length:297 start_codon:yes stop_codon:yes gene_type:complete
MEDDSLKDKFKSLYVSVIFQALMDLKKLNTSITDTSVSLHSEAAHSWFFTTSGTVCKDFEEVCDNADLKPTFVRQFAYDVINAGDDNNVEKRITKFFT